MHPVQATDDQHQTGPGKPPFPHHNPGYALRSFPLYTFLSRGGYFYILTLENQAEFPEESILGQTNPCLSLRRPTFTPPPPPLRHTHRETTSLFALKCHVESMYDTYRDAAQQNSLRLWLQCDGIGCDL
uniref:Uncharacterized protein n=1 Tax=Mus spicilegus TaxID=10103 RepID=A0A8C6H1C9_MUSSI